MHIVSVAFKFQLHRAIQSGNLEKKIALGEHLTFFIVFSKDKCNRSKISLSKSYIILI